MSWDNKNCPLHVIVQVSKSKNVGSFDVACFRELEDRSQQGLGYSLRHKRPTHLEKYTFRNPCLWLRGKQLRDGVYLSGGGGGGMYVQYLLHILFTVQNNKCRVIQVRDYEKGPSRTVGPMVGRNLRSDDGHT